MEQDSLMDIIELASADIRAIDARALGIAVIVMYRDDDDELMVMVGSDVPPEIVRIAVRNLARGLARDNSDFSRVERRPLRKAV